MSINNLEFISWAGARQVVNTRYFSLNYLIEHVYIRCEKFNVNVVNYDMSDQKSIVCEVSCGKNKNEVCYQKSVQDFSKFDVWVFMNNFNVKIEKKEVEYNKL